MPRLRDIWEKMMFKVKSLEISLCYSIVKIEYLKHLSRDCFKNLSEFELNYS